MSETLDDVLSDAERVFGFDKDTYYTDRAHDYLRERRVARTYDDTAMLCVVRDLVARAAEAATGVTPELAERMVDEAEALLALARELRGVGDAG